jgi:hypothetical protein
MNEITYRPDEEPGFSAILKRQAETHADFTYSLSGNVISIVDLNLGNRSLTNDIESVLRKIEHYHQGSIVGFNIMYRDSEGVWDGINWDGEHASFFALRETEEGRAREKLLARSK